MDGNLTPLQRFFLAFVAFFYVLFNARFAEEVKQVRDRQRKALPPPSPEQPPNETPASRATVTVPPPPAAPLEPAPVPAPAAAPAPAPAAAPAPPAPAPAPAVPSSDTVAMHVLGILQRDGRLIDFLSESLEGFSDSEIGAAARTVHEGCRKTLDSYVQLEPVFREPEGASVTIVAGFDPATVRLTGNVVGSPPFKGSLRHHGWRATRAAFPPIPPEHDPRILAPAEVEL